MNSKAFALLITALPLQISAAIIFEKGPVQTSNFALTSSPNGQQMADYFTPSVSANISSVKWFGSFIPGGSGQSHDYSIRFFKDVNNTPATTPLFQTTVTSPAQVAFTPGGAYPIYSMQAVLPTPLTIDANQRVWISIVDLNPTPTSEFKWQESRSASAPFNWASRTGEASPWLAVGGGALAFTLEGTVVPEPGTISLTLLGLTGIALLRFRTRHCA